MAKTLPQKLFTHGGAYVLVRVLDSATGFVLVPIYAAYLGEGGYGTMSLILTSATFLTTILLQGQIVAWMRLRYDVQEERRKSLETTIFWYAHLSLAVGVSLFALFGEPFARWLVPGVEFPLICLGLAAIALTAPSMFCNRTLQEAQRPRAFFFLNLSTTVLRTAFIVVLVAGFKLDVLGVLLSHLCSGVILFFGALYYLRPSWPWNGRRDLLAESLRFGLPVVGHSLSTQVNAFADRLIVNHFIGAAATGNYSMGYKLASLLGMAGTALNQAFSPLLNRGLTDADSLDPENARKITDSIRRAALLQVALIGIMALGITAPARELIWLMTHGRFEQAWQVIPLVTAGTLIVSTYQPFACSLIYHKRTRQLPLVSTTGAVVNLGLNWVLIPRIGIMGAALATLISAVVFLSLVWWFTRDVFQPLVGSRWLVLLAATLTALAGLACADWTIPSLWWRGPIKLAIGGAGVLIILWLSGARLRDLRALFKRRKGVAAN